MSCYLGFDCSTQSLTVIVLDVSGTRPAVILERSLAYDDVLPSYGTRHGVLPAEDPRVALSPPGMWADALDLAMAVVTESGVDRREIAAISGSAQQHGSVYLAEESTRCLRELNPLAPPTEQLVGVFSRPVAPIWMDASTSAECAEITVAMGGAERLARITGSRAFERFTGPQIRRFWKTDPAGYAATSRIHMVSSFLASLLVGSHAPLDPGDASGMNLMDLSTSDWAPDALTATAPDLVAKLPSVMPSSTVVGRLAPYWQTRHGLPDARVVAWSGDNPCSLIGTGLVREGTVAVSLGTSDTLFGAMTSPRVDAGGVGHVFGAPTGDFMGLTCFRNGSLARERVRDDYGLDWAAFDAALASTPPGNRGALMLPWFEPEITPDVPRPRVHRKALDSADSAANVRAVIEAQMMAIANHSEWMDVTVDAIHATGGASANRAILQVMADVFAADVYQFESTNSAALGAALRAWHADRTADGRPVSWEFVVRDIASPAASSRIRPVESHVGVYRQRRREYAAFERTARAARPT